MKFGKITAAVIASSIAVAPIAAQATVGERSAPIAGENAVGGDSNGAMLAIFALLAAGIAVVASNGGGDSEPLST